jgi:hypothetical protein
LDGARISWEIAHDVTMATYEIYRQTRTDAGRVRMEEAAHRQGQRYQILDRDPPADGADYWLEVVPSGNEPSWFGPAHLKSVEPNAALRLGPPTPNPFRMETRLEYATLETGVVRASVFDPGGRLVRSLWNAKQERGTHSVIWDGSDESGERLPAGIYFLRVSTKRGAWVQKVTLLRSAGGYLDSSTRRP